MKNKKFKYVIMAVILLIPFIYSFFYLKAYWDPYGKGNIDNLPVAIINNDKGDKGNKLVQSIQDKKKLKLSVVSNDKAYDGLYDGTYYAIINIPENFTSDMESAANKEKYHATITYSPNQKSNYLSSQIINNVVLNVEKNLDNEVNSQIVSKLSQNIQEVPSKLDTISNGFGTLKDGTGKLASGSNTLTNGVDTLTSGINTAYDGSTKIKSALDSKISELKADNLPALTNEQLEQIGTLAKVKAQSQINESQIKAAALASVKNSTEYNIISSFISFVESNYVNSYKNIGINNSAGCNNLPDISSVATCKDVFAQYDTLVAQRSTMELVAQNVAYSTTVQTVPLVAESTAKQTAETVANEAKNKATETSINSLTELSANLGKLNSGLNDLYLGSLKLGSGTHTLNNGLITLDNSVKTAKDELDTNIKNTKDSVSKTENLSDYSKEPVKINTKEVNKINSYGTAFSPIFISIGLWVGCLMLLIVLYYDKEERFGVLGINSNKKVKQVLAYHGMITAASVVLGILLQLFLDFNISNVLLYYLVLILIGNAFMAIIEFLVITFSDVGKFIALIILVLQLAAAGGTFPIETVTKGFRWIHEYLPMTYTVKLLKEVLMNFENNLFTKNLIVVVLMFIVFFTLNIILAYLKEKKIKK